MSGYKVYRVKYVDKNNWIYSEKGKVRMKSTEKIAEEIIIIKYYNVLFYLFFMRERDSLKKQCLVNRLESGELLRMKKIQEWCDYHQIFFTTQFVYRKDFPFTASLWNLYSYCRFKMEQYYKKIWGCRKIIKLDDRAMPSLYT